MKLSEDSRMGTYRSSRYFEAHIVSQALQPISSTDETELEEEWSKPIFGEALAFYTTSSPSASLVVYHPLIECQKLYGRWYGRWSPDVMNLLLPKQ